MVTPVLKTERKRAKIPVARPVTFPIQPNSKNQHYVWQHYLNAWVVDGNFYCYRQKNRHFFPTQPKSVASETYFYEILELTPADLKFLDEYISKATDEHLRTLNRDYVKMTQLPFELRRLITSQSLPKHVRENLEEHLRWAERNLSERYHAGVENRAQDILEMLHKQDDSFYRVDERCVDFLYFLSLQYFRTAKMKNGLSVIPAYVPGHDQRRTANILNHIHATNVGYTLFRERKNYRILFLKNATLVPFITGDQPVLNLLNPKATNDVELYYPLSPSLSILLTNDSLKFSQRERSVTTFEVEHDNFAIYAKSEDQLYSNDGTYLRSLIATDKHLSGIDLSVYNR